MVPKASHGIWHLSGGISHLNTHILRAVQTANLLVNILRRCGIPNQANCSKAQPNLLFPKHIPISIFWPQLKVKWLLLRTSKPVTSKCNSRKHLLNLATVLPEFLSTAVNMAVKKDYDEQDALFFFKVAWIVAYAYDPSSWEAALGGAQWDLDQSGSYSKFWDS